ncbi:MAG: SAM-dependent methyltransferase [Elusimicrobia bacterium]|nr:MAG: SAM-dependent methyltransferase [Elusimicrobiota bacterium]
MKPPLRLPKTLTAKTLTHYEQNPDAFWEATKDHDVSQNYAALFRHIPHTRPWTLLDLGCGPGRDLKYFTASGHTAIGLEGCESFCSMARKYSGCEVLHRDFLDMKLPTGSFHGIFANASLFHVPKPEFHRVLKDLHAALRNGGILFSSNPRGHGEDFSSTRYANLMELEDYQGLVEGAGFELVEHYYRPGNVPQEEARWLACVFKKLPA